MPELPEVETVRQILKQQLIGKTIVNVFAVYDKILKDKETILSYLPGKEIKDILRFGKYLVFDLGEKSLIVHLRMEGKFYLKNSEEILDKHEHLVIRFADFDLRYHDTRKFGTFNLRNNNELFTTKPLIDLGKEPKDININDFHQKISKSNKPIKSILLDQTIISGLGNIYVDETLFRSRIHPLRKGINITFEEAKSLVESAIYVLDFATKLGGTTIRSYTSSLGVTGRFQNELQIHMRVNEKCYVCQNEIIKIKVGGRGTYVCEFCQK